MTAAPAASKQAELDWALALCDRAMDLARSAGLTVSVVVADPGGDPVQQDRMDGAAAAGVDVAAATAATAARFGCSSAEVAEQFGAAAPALAALHPVPFLAAAGGVVLFDGTPDRRRSGYRRRRPGEVRRPCGRSRRRMSDASAEVVRVAVLGCGAIGSLYAAHLARVPGVEVWAVDPWAEHMAAIDAGGLRVIGHADFVAPVRALTDAGGLPACDFALVATKALHTREAVEAARHALTGAAVASLQNGIGNEEVVAEVVPLVIRGSIVTAGHVTEPGVVRYDGPGDSCLGPFEPSPARRRPDRGAGRPVDGGRPPIRSWQRCLGW